MPNHRTRILYRRDGKGRRCSLGDSIASIPCRAGRVEEKADLHPILQLVLVQISLFFNSPWFKSAYSSTRPGSNQPILQLVLVQISLILCSSSSLKMQRQPFPSLLYKPFFYVIHYTVHKTFLVVFLLANSAWARCRCRRAAPCCCQWHSATSPRSWTFWGNRPVRSCKSTNRDGGWDSPLPL